MANWRPSHCRWRIVELTSFQAVQEGGASLSKFQKRWIRSNEALLSGVSTMLALQPAAAVDRQG